MKRWLSFTEGRQSILLKELAVIGAFRSCGILLTYRVCYKTQFSSVSNILFESLLLKRWRNVVVHLKAIIRILKLLWYREPECVTESLKSLESMMLNCSLFSRSQSQFDRRSFRSRVHSIETKRQFGRSKGFEREVSDDKNGDPMLDYSSFFYPLSSSIFLNRFDK